MRKSIGIIATMGIMLVSAYWLGTMQAETITETREVIPDGYIDTNATVFHDNYVNMREVVDFEVSDDGLQLYLKDGTGYWLER